MEHRFIKNRDIVLFSMQSWDFEIGSNFKDMAFELAKHNRVLYVNRAFDRFSYLREKNNPALKTRIENLRTGNTEITKIQNNLWVLDPRTIVESINSIPFGWLHDQLNKVNNKRLATQINKAINTLELKDVIIINDNDFLRGYYIKEMVPCASYIFYIRDYMLGVPFWQKHGKRLEPSLMKKSDVVVANSSYLAKYSSKANAHSYDIGQGCELENYLVENPSIPDDLTNIPKPVIGYTGAVFSLRLDEAILKKIATSLPGCSIVLVGPADEQFSKSELQQFKNVHFLGSKPPALLPNYIYHFDICMNPQILNEVTIGNYPRKVDEYLAVGKPVVVTKTEGMKMFEPYTFLCESGEEYVQQIQKILQDPATRSDIELQRRRTFALSHTWENSMGKLGDALYAATIK